MHHNKVESATAKSLQVQDRYHAKITVEAMITCERIKRADLTVDIAVVQGVCSEDRK